ncbi:hypothetical protein [Aquimarina rhabdastrellae]
MSKVIVFEEEAFFKMLEEVVSYVSKLKQLQPKPEWISEEELKQLLNIRSKSQIWKLRTENKIVYSQPSKKLILYSRKSVENYINEGIVNDF